jgi:hypothetical protein
MNAINEVVGTTATLSVLGGLVTEELQIRLVFGHSHGCLVLNQGCGFDTWLTTLKTSRAAMKYEMLGKDTVSSEALAMGCSNCVIARQSRLATFKCM